MKRLFLALSLPQTFKQDLEMLRQKIQGNWPELKYHWTRTENLHLTLLFLGDQNKTTQTLLCRRLRSLDFAAFELMFNRVGCFYKRRGNQKIAHILWLAAMRQSNDKTLLTLRQAILSQIVIKDRKSQDLAQRLAGKKIRMPSADVSNIFYPHITLGRSKNISCTKWQQSQGEINQLCQQIRYQFLVEHFDLYSSTLTPSGPLYRVEQRFWAHPLSQPDN